MPIDRIALALAGLMFTASVGAIVARPTAKVAEQGPRLSLAAMIPQQFGHWRDEPEQSAEVVNPQTQALLDKLYSQILTRTYVDEQGYRVMLSVAYGSDQREGMRAHKPEVCYPSHGFTLGHSEAFRLQTPYGDIAARRMLAVLGPRREPVIYWYTIANRSIDGALAEKLEEMRLGLTGRIPDGLLFRVSSIDGDEENASRRQLAFIQELLAALPAADRLRLSGLGPDQGRQAASRTAVR